MKISKKIITFLLVITTLLLLISFFLPMVESSTKNETLKDMNTNAYSIYEITSFDFNVLYVLIPALAMVFVILKNKYTETIAYGLYISSFFINLLFLLNLNTNLASLTGKYKIDNGFIILLVCSATVCFFSIILIIINLITKATNKVIIEVNSDALKRSLENLNTLRDQNFITSAEYEEKRASLVKQLKF